MIARRRASSQSAIKPLSFTYELYMNIMNSMHNRNITQQNADSLVELSQNDRSEVFCLIQSKHLLLPTTRNMQLISKYIAMSKAQQIIIQGKHSFGNVKLELPIVHAETLDYSNTLLISIGGDEIDVDCAIMKRCRAIIIVDSPQVPYDYLQQWERLGGEFHCNTVDSFDHGYQRSNVGFAMLH